jgi:hypothetical protein
LTHYRRAWKPERHLHGDSATEAFHAIAEVLSGSGTSVYKFDELTKRFREELMARRLREDT